MPKRKLTSISNEAASNKRQATGDSTVTEEVGVASTPSEMDSNITDSLHKFARCFLSFQDGVISGLEKFLDEIDSQETGFIRRRMKAQNLYRKAVLVLLPLAGTALHLADAIRQPDHAIHEACLVYQIIMARTENELVRRRFMEQSLVSPRSLVSSVSSSIGKLCDEAKPSLVTITEVEYDIAQILEKEEGNNDLLELQELLSAFFKAKEMLARRVQKFDADMDALALKYPVDVEKLDPEGKLARLEDVKSQHMLHDDASDYEW
jgi:hypothetical protein